MTQWRIPPLFATVLALAACKTTPLTLSPVVKPSGAEWQQLTAAKKSLTDAQQTLAARQKDLSVASAQESVFQGGKLAYSPFAEHFLSAKDKVTFQAETDKQSKAATDRVSAATAAVQDGKTQVASAQQQVAAAEAAVDTITRDQFNKQFTTVVNECKAIVTQYQKGSTGGAKTAFWLQVSGLIAGAVAAPALVAASSVGNKAWIAGISGYAGGTNLAETSLGNANLNGISDATTANQLAAKIRADISTALGKSSWDDRYDALNEVVADCSLFQIGVPTAQPANGFGGGQSKDNGTPPPAPAGGS